MKRKSPVKEYFDIFIGGPMGKPEDDGAGTSFNDHIPAIRRALLRVRDDLASDFPNTVIRINTPEIDESGMITDRVFGLIDTAELAVMDVSANSPSVMYEMAMLHALGTPTIPLILRLPDGSRQVPYYLKDTYQAVVDDFREDTLFARLQPMVRAVIGGGGLGANPAMNPMTGYYGLPLVDVSASTGLATGYFHNFVQHVIKQNGGVFSALGDAVEALVILRPTKLSDAVSLKQMTEKRLLKEGIATSRVTRDGTEVFRDEEQTRKEMLIYRAGRFLFDGPSPLAAQEGSPRYKRILRMEMDTRGPFQDEARALAQRFEAQMIAQFFATIRYLSRTYPNVNPNRLEFLTLDEFVARLKT